MQEEGDFDSSVINDESVVQEEGSHGHWNKINKLNDGGRKAICKVGMSVKMSDMESSRGTVRNPKTRNAQNRSANNSKQSIAVHSSVEASEPTQLQKSIFEQLTGQNFISRTIDGRKTIENTNNAHISRSQNSGARSMSQLARNTRMSR